MCLEHMPKDGHVDNLNSSSGKGLAVVGTAMGLIPLAIRNALSDKKMRIMKAS